MLRNAWLPKGRSVPLWKLENMNNLTIEDLKTIRLALSKYPLSTGLIGTLGKIDDALATHNIKAVYKTLPKRKYQRQASGEYQFLPIKK